MATRAAAARESSNRQMRLPGIPPEIAPGSQPVHRRSADRDQQIDAAFGGRAAASLVQIASGVTELLHFAEHRDAPAGGRRGRERAQHHVHRRGTGVVGVVDHRHAARRGANGAATGHRLSRRERLFNRPASMP